MLKICGGGKGTGFKPSPHVNQYFTPARLAGENLGEWMGQLGLALAYRRYSLDYVNEEAGAQTARRGIWASSRFEGQQQSRKLSSAGSAAGAQTTEVQVTRLGATLPQHPFCDLQHFLSPASSPQTTDAEGTSNRIVLTCPHGLVPSARLDS